ncbi:MAG: hypothetical protein U1F35_08780 [Steroidobacteraceae bacterium]
MKQWARQLGLLWLLFAATSSHAGEKLVLIASADSRVEQLDSLEVRKLFLGLTVIHDGMRLRPLLNETDGQIKAVFLQNIVSMSEISYDHHLLGMALKQGRPRPEPYADEVRLYAAVAADPAALSFAWMKDVEHNPRLKVLRVLWHD